MQEDLGRKDYPLRLAIIPIVRAAVSASPPAAKTRGLTLSHPTANFIIAPLVSTCVKTCFLGFQGRNKCGVDWRCNAELAALSRDCAVDILDFGFAAGHVVKQH